ncbi:serine--tRNA ligase [Candidatus Woesearchaeota archaeon]|nr:serine--tRNA ligase [Candidatus Woesearchaeota archaeon]
MLDIKLIRENSKLVKENIKKRFQKDKLKYVDEVLEKDKQYRKLLYDMEQLKHKRNLVSKEINELRKEGKNIKKKVLEAKKIPEKLKGKEEKVIKLKQEIKELLCKIPNIIHNSVPLGEDHTKNVEIEKIGKPKKFNFDVKSHVELTENLGIVDFDASARVSGNGFFYLKGDLARLNQALIRFGIDFMLKKGYLFVEPPLMIREEVLNGVYSHEEIEEMSYKVDGEDLYLIATSEHPLIGMFINQTVDAEELPLKICSYSQCFRKEIGSHGIDEKGLFRTHQFNKVEMVVLCGAKDSYKFYDEMLNISKDIFKQLEIPTRVLECCSGDLGDLKAKSCDLEYWSPRKKDYNEFCSLTNMEEAQARRLNIRADDKGDRFYVHTLNNTAIATSRAMVAILENNQTKDGEIIVPKVLQKYLGGLKIIKKRKR